MLFFLTRICCSYCFLVYVSGVTAFGQVDSPGEIAAKVAYQAEINFDDLLIRTAVARESLVQFVVDVTVVGQFSTPSLILNGAGTPDRSEYHFEKSVINKHCVYARRAFVGNNSGPWSLDGVSGKYFFQSTGSNLIIKNWPLERPAAPSGGFNIRLFDVRAIGIGTYGDLSKGATFEEIIRNLIDNPVESRTARYKKEFGQYVYDDLGAGIRLLIDPSKGYWPTEFRFAPPSLSQESHWKVTLREQEGEYLPESAELVLSDKSKNTHRSLLFDFRWRTINETVEDGLPAIRRLSEQFGFSIDDSRIRE